MLIMSETYCFPFRIFAVLVFEVLRLLNEAVKNSSFSSAVFAIFAFKRHCDKAAGFKPDSLSFWNILAHIYTVHLNTVSHFSVCANALV